MSGGTLEDKDAIRDLMYGYGRGVDRLDADQVQAVFHADAELDYGAFVGSPKAFAEMLLADGPNLKATHHNMTNILISVDGDIASAETYAVSFHSGKAEADGLVDFIGYTRYADRLERRNGVWKIAARKAMVDARMVVPHAEARPSSLGASILAGKRDRSDPTYALTPPVGAP